MTATENNLRTSARSTNPHSTPPEPRTSALHAVRKQTGASCNGCGNTWTGLSRAHCAAEGCHRTFGSVGLFDRHRSSAGKHGTCLDPTSITNSNGERVMFYRDGMWRGPEMTEEQKAALFG